MGMFKHRQPAVKCSEEVPEIKKGTSQCVFAQVGEFPYGDSRSSEKGSDVDFEEYSKLCNDFIDECESILQDTYPHECYDNREDDFNNEIEAYGEVKQESDIEPNPSQPSALPDNKTGNTLDTSTPSQVIAQPEKSAAPHTTKRPNSYNLCQRFLSQHSIRNCGGLLYIYMETCYTLLTADIAKGMILDGSRKEIGAYGSPEPLRDVYDFLRAETSIRVSDGCEDSSYVVFKNGRLNLDTGGFEHNGPDVFAVTYLNFKYSNDTNCQNFKDFLRQISGGNKSLEKRIWEIIGYCWSPDMRAKACFLFKGMTGTGKSTLLRLIRSGLVMNEGECSISVHELSSRFALANLMGKRLISDGDYGDIPLSPQNIAIIKNLTGLDSVRSERKGVDAVTVCPSAKLIICSNTALSLRKQDKAFEERVIVVPFENPVSEDDRDPNLLEKLQAELPAIANIAFKHYAELKERGYRFSELDCDAEGVKVAGEHVQKVAVVNYEAGIKGFCEEYCESCNDGFEFTEDLFNAYLGYCNARGLSTTNKKYFSTLFKKISGLEKCKREAQNGYLGVKLKESEEN